jgi:hypothetical protein
VGKITLVKDELSFATSTPISFQCVPIISYELYEKVPGLGQERSAGSTYSISGHLLQNSLFGNIDSEPIVFPTLQKHCGNHLP